MNFFEGECVYNLLKYFKEYVVVENVYFILFIIFERIIVFDKMYSFFVNFCKGNVKFLLLFMFGWKFVFMEKDIIFKIKYFKVYLFLDVFWFINYFFFWLYDEKIYLYSE